MPRDHRRLAAIVSADVVGYSRLMGCDESGTLAALKAQRAELIDPATAEHSGRLVKTTGDGLLLEFFSVVDAVRWAVEVQCGMAQRNADKAVGQRIDFRIGINVGDIIIDDDDIFGDGVNVAARLQTLAEPGEICVSRAVRDQVLDKLSFSFEDLGAQDVKNIARPVEVYQLDLDSVGHAPPSSSTWRRISRVLRWRWLSLSVVGAVVLGASLVIRTLPPFSESALTRQRPAMSVAVLPFFATIKGSEDVQLADTATQVVTSLLENSARYAKVTSYSVASNYKDKPVDARVLGQQLNVRYVVEGQIRRAGERVALDARLVETADGTQAWSDHLEADQAQLVATNGTILRHMVGRLRGAIASAELRRAGGLLAPDASALDITLHGNAVELNDPDPMHGAIVAQKFYDDALRLDPGLVLALVSKAALINQELEWNPRADRNRLVRELDELSSRALALDDKDPRVWVIRAGSLTRQQRWMAAVEAAANASKLDPTRVEPFVERAEIMVQTGQPAEALALIDQATALDTWDSRWTAFTMFVRCRAQMAVGEYGDAIKSCERSVAGGDWWMAHCYLVAAYTQQGNFSQAASEKVTLEKFVPRFSISDFKAARPSDNPIYMQQTEAHLFAGLRKAGIPES